jgi:hypothetical protein
VARYDQRKNYEEAEANAIGTEYVRADFLPPEGAARVRELLRRYVDQRVAFYLSRDEGHIGQINADTEKLQAELWSAIVPGPRWSGSTRRHRLNNASPAPERRHIARPPANGARDGRQDRYCRDRRLGPHAQIG